MAIKQDTLQSNVAGVGVMPQAKRLEEAKKKGTKRLKIAALGAALIPGVGVGASYFLDRKRHKRERNNQMEELAKDYRSQVAAVLGMNPENVTADDLELAAKQNRELGQVVQKLDDEKKMSNRRSTGSNAAVAVVGTLIPGAGLVTRLAADATAGTVGDQLAKKIYDKKILYVNDIVGIIDAKLKSQQPVTAYDIMMLRAAKDQQWQKDFLERYKAPFHQMSDEVRAGIIASMPQLMAGAEAQAHALNTGIMVPQELVMEGVSSGSNYADSVINKATKGSFVSSETSRRLAAQQQQTSLS